MTNEARAIEISRGATIIMNRYIKKYMEKGQEPDYGEIASNIAYAAATTMARHKDDEFKEAITKIKEIINNL